MAGYRVALTRSDAQEFHANGMGIAELVLRRDANGGAAAYGVSDSSGLIRFTNLVRAKYFVQVDAGDLPTVTTKAPVVVDVPCPDFDIQVSLLWAAAFRFVADQVVAHTSFTAGPDALLRGPASPQDYRTVQRWRRDLAKRFDGATVVVGLPTSKAMRGERARVYSFGKMCGWLECEVPIVPIPKLESPTDILTPSLGECAGRLTVQPVDARGNRVNLRGSQATVNTTWQGQDAYLLLELGESTLVPAGLLRIAPSSSLPAAAFAATSREVSAAAEVVADVVVGDLWQVRVIPKLPEGRAPSRWGLRLGGDRRESLGMAEESFAFWTGARSMDLVVFCQGREPVRARLERAANEPREVPVDFIALLGPVVPGR